jgi:hypothetical protein
MIGVKSVFGSPEQRQLLLARADLILTSFLKGSAGSVHMVLS